MTVMDRCRPGVRRTPERPVSAAWTRFAGGLPLRRLAVDGRITGLLYRLTVAQTFVNVHADPLEATYIFPLPARAGVTRFQLRVGERVIEGVLKERGAAREEYDQAIQQGHRAAIAEEERPEVFTMRVGNIPPGETVGVELELAGPLAVADGEATFRFPLVVAPRYIPGVPLDGPGGRSGHGTGYRRGARRQPHRPAGAAAGATQPGASGLSSGTGSGRIAAERLARQPARPAPEPDRRGFLRVVELTPGPNGWTAMSSCASGSARRPSAAGSASTGTPDGESTVLLTVVPPADAAGLVPAPRRGGVARPVRLDGAAGRWRRRGGRRRG